MTLTTELTARDKKLLIFLAAFLIVAGCLWFFIKPAVDDIMSLDTGIAVAQAQQQKNRIAIEQIESSEEILNRRRTALADGAEKYYERMESQEIDRLLTLEALAFGFDNSDLRELYISNPESFLRFAFYLSGEKPEQAPEITGVYGATVSFTIHGTRDMLQSFCNKLASEYDAIHVTGFVWQELKREEGYFLLTMELQILMTDAAQMIAEQPLADGTPAA